MYFYGRRVSRLFARVRAAPTLPACSARGATQGATSSDSSAFAPPPPKTVELFDEDKARECDVVFLAVDGDFSLAHAENLCRGDDGPVVIDNSSAFRFVDGIPLVVPEINADECKGQKLIANPNCTTAIGLMAIWPLHQLFGLKKMVMSVRASVRGWPVGVCVSGRRGFPSRPPWMVVSHSCGFRLGYQ